MALEVQVFPYCPGEEEDVEPLEFLGVDMISYVNDDTYGKPAIIAPGPDKYEGQLPITVLYINTSKVTAVEVIRQA